MTSRLITTIVVWLVPWLVGLLGVASPAAAVSLDAPADTYAYNAPESSAEIARAAATGRRPPTITYDYTAPRMAVDVAPNGHSARPLLATTLTYTAYDRTGQLAQGTGGPGTTRPVAVGREVDTRVVQRSQVAAKSGSDLIRARDVGFTQDSVGSSFRTGESVLDAAEDWARWARRRVGWTPTRSESSRRTGPSTRWTIGDCSRVNTRMCPCRSGGRQEVFGGFINHGQVHQGQEQLGMVATMRDGPDFAGRDRLVDAVYEMLSELDAGGVWDNDQLP